MTSIDRRTLLGGIAVGTTGLAAAATGLVSAKGAFAATHEHALNFALLGDWGRGTDAQNRVAAAMGAAAAAAQSRFTLTVGDNFYEKGVLSTDDALWKKYFEDVYTHPALQTPWHIVLGNHDYEGNPQAQVDYTAQSNRWRLPQRYYKVADASLDQADVDLFVIDTSPLVHKYREDVKGMKAKNVATQDVDAQMAWLDGALAASKRKWKLVAGHHTIHSGGSAHGDTPEMVEQVKPILLRHGVQAYLGGHDHDLQHIHRDGLHIIQSGSGSEARPVKAVAGTLYCTAQPGFCMMKVAGDTLSFEFRDAAGKSLYRAALPARAGQRAA